jgi:ketosteroid isomerase-like protein
MVAVSYKPFSVHSKYFERNARRKSGREAQRKDRHWYRETEEKMTVAELMHHNFDEIFIELDPVKREAMMRNAFTEDCVWIHPGGRLVGIAAVNEAASGIRKHIPEYRYTVVGDIHTMHNVGMCRWGSGLPGQPFRYTGTDVLEERDGRVAVFYTFIDSGTPPVSSTK